MSNAPFTVTDAAQALETLCVSHAENDEEQRLTYEHACEVTKMVAELERELKMLRPIVGALVGGDAERARERAIDVLVAALPPKLRRRLLGRYAP